MLDNDRDQLLFCADASSSLRRTSTVCLSRSTCADREIPVSMKRHSSGQEYALEY